MRTKVKLDLTLKKAVARILICAHEHSGGKMMHTADKLKELVAEKYKKNYGTTRAEIITFAESLDELVYTGWLVKGAGSKVLYGITAEGTRAATTVIGRARSDPVWEKYTLPSHSPNVAAATVPHVYARAPQSMSLGATI